MNLKEKVKYVVTGVVCAAVLFFLYSAYRQIQENKANIATIGQYLTNANKVSAPESKPVVKPVEKEAVDEKD